MRMPPSLRASVLWLGLVLQGCGAQTSGPEAPVLAFTAIPDQNSTELEEKFQPLATFLSGRLEVPVRYVPVRDYQASVELFKNGDVLLAWFGGLTGVQARHSVDGARAIAQGETDRQYFAYFIAHQDTGLERSEEFPVGLSEFTFTFGSQSSTSGRLMPEYFIRQSTGLSPGDFFRKTVGFSGSHDKTAELVESGQFQAGVLNYQVYDQRVAEGKIHPDVARVIWKTPPFADYNWTAHPRLEKDFGEGFISRLQEALLSIDDPVLLSALPRERLVEASNDDYESIRQIAVELGMLR